MDEPPLSENHKAALNTLRDQFALINDDRQPGKVRHVLPDVLLSALGAMLCGCDDFSAMATFAKHRLEWLREFLPMKQGPPSHDIYRNVFMMVKPAEFIEVLSKWFGPLTGEHIAIDGKAIRSSYDRDRRKCLVVLLRAWIDKRSLSVGQVACREKSNEIEAIPRLLDSLVLEGATVTIDAAGCQTAIAEQIHEGGGTYILGLKGNQGEAHRVVTQHFEKASAPCDAMTEEKGHGRYEKRECWVEEDLSFFDKSWKWHGLTGVVRIRRETCRMGGRGTDGAEASVENHYYLCSTEPDAARILALVRSHWGIENRCHWTLDVVFGEDASPVRDRTAAQNLSTLRDLSIHLLRSHPKKASLPKKRLEAILNPDLRAEIITGVHA